MFKDEFKARYTTIPFAVYRAYCVCKTQKVITHHHKETELISMTEGHADFYVDNILYKLKKGDVLIIPPFSIHRAETSDNETVAYNCICLDLELLWDKDIKSGLENHTLFVNNLIDSKLSYAQKIQNWIEVGCTACEDAYPGWELDAIGCISMIFGSLKRNGHFSSEIKIGKKNDFAEKVINYISANFVSPITSTSAATSLFMNNSYFCRTFKKSFGCCFSDYVLAYRLEKARIYLSSTNDKITDISFNTGFNSCSYFSKAFKERFGATPVFYRKKTSR